MEKAYDLAVLTAKLKDRGLVLVEGAAKGVIEDVLGWVEESAKLSATPYDDMGLVILPQLKALALKEADKIDGKVKALDA